MTVASKPKEKSKPQTKSYRQSVSRIRVPVHRELSDLLQHKIGKRSLGYFILDVLANYVGRRDLADAETTYRISDRYIKVCDIGIAMIIHQQPGGWVQLERGIRALIEGRFLNQAKKYIGDAKKAIAAGVRCTPRTAQTIAEIEDLLESKRIDVGLEKLPIYHAGPPTSPGRYAIIRCGKESIIHIKPQDGLITPDPTIEFHYLLPAWPMSGRTTKPTPPDPTPSDPLNHQLDHTQTQ